MTKHICTNCKHRGKCTFYKTFPDIAVYMEKVPSNCEEWEPI